MEILFSFGSLKVYTMSLFVVVAFFWGGMVVARKAAEYHFGETEVFDAITLGLIGVGFLAKLFGVFGLGADGFVGLFMAVIGASFFLAKRTNEKVWTTLDVMTLGVPMVFVWWNLGLFWAGSFSGLPLSGGWGVVAESLQVWPVELVRSFLFLMVFVWLWKLEGEYRCFDWYKGRKSTANTGFIFGAMLFFWGVIEIVGGLMSGGNGEWFFFERGIVLFIGVALIYWRSGRVLTNDLASITARFRRVNSVN